jgi:hypothetical protein
MSFEETQKKIKALEVRASNISSSSDEMTKEVNIRMLLTDYLQVDPRSPLEHYVKITLLDYFVDKNPFPIVTEKLKIKAGAPKKNNIDAAKISYYLLKNKGSIKKTSELLQIDRKTVKSRYKYAQDVSKAILSGEYPPDKLELLSKLNDSLFLDEFNADLQRHENTKKKTKL